MSVRIKHTKIYKPQFINYHHDASHSSRLEIYEQSCAVDSVTKKCAGKTSSCRIALLGIMGTPLRTLCACQGSDLQQLYECLGWQRLLWLNPCVGKSNSYCSGLTQSFNKKLWFTVESQKDFHVKRLAELGLLVTTTTTTTQRTTLRTTPTTTTTTSTPATIRITVKEKERLLTPAPPEIVMKISLTLFIDFSQSSFSRPQTFHRPPEQEIETEIESNYIDNSQDNNYIPSELFEQDNKDDDVFYSGVTTEMLEMEMSTLPTTTTVETTTIPISEFWDVLPGLGRFKLFLIIWPLTSSGYCVVQRPHTVETQYIAEGKSRRVIQLILQTFHWFSWLCLLEENSLTPCFSLSTALHHGRSGVQRVVFMWHRNTRLVMSRSLRTTRSMSNVASLL